MKHVLKTIALFCLGAITMASCGDEPTPTKQEEEETLEVFNTELDFSRDADSKVVSVITTGVWYVENDSDWITVSPMGGKGNGQITVSVSKNTSAQPRESHFSIAIDSDSKVIGVSQEEGYTYNYSESIVVVGGPKSPNGSFYTSDKGVQTKTQLADQAQNVIFCFSFPSLPTDNEPFPFISGTVAENELVKKQASETKFAVIDEAETINFEKLTENDFTQTAVEISSIPENGRYKAVAFKNDKCQGFFEVVNWDKKIQDLTLHIWTVTEINTK